MIEVYDDSEVRAAKQKAINDAWDAKLKAMRGPVKKCQVCGGHESNLMHEYEENKINHKARLAEIEETGKHCLSVWTYRTACGQTFTRTVDSSD